MGFVFVTGSFQKEIVILFHGFIVTPLPNPPLKGREKQ
jgi:hypothetical protein